MNIATIRVKHSGNTHSHRLCLIVEDVARVLPAPSLAGAWRITIQSSGSPNEIKLSWPLASMDMLPPLAQLESVLRSTIGEDTFLSLRITRLGESEARDILEYGDGSPAFVPSYDPVTIAMVSWVGLGVEGGVDMREAVAREFDRALRARIVADFVADMSGSSGRRGRRRERRVHLWGG